MKVLQDYDIKGNKVFVETATKAQAEAGTSDTVLITPLSMQQGINALGGGINLDGGLSNSVYTTGKEIEGGDASGS